MLLVQLLAEKRKLVQDVPVLENVVLEALVVDSRDILVEAGQGQVEVIHGGARYMRRLSRQNAGICK